MAWDFQTDPAFEEKLAWMRTFVKEEIFPIETLKINREQLMHVIKPLQDEVKKRGLWAAQATLLNFVL